MAELMRGREWLLLIALAVGLLIGAEREPRKSEDQSHRPAGVCWPRRSRSCSFVAWMQSLE